MKTYTIFLLFISGILYGQNYLIAFTQPKSKDGCVNVSYQKFEVKDQSDYYKQSETLKKKYANDHYKDYYVSANEYAVVIQITAQYSSISCKYRKYEFMRSKKSLEEARTKMNNHIKQFHGLYVDSPIEISVFEPKS